MPRSRRRHYRLTLAEAISAHDRAIHQFGGRDGVSDLSRIEAAIARPYSGYYRPLHKKATALIEALVMNHGFVDGNKRTAYYLLDLLIRQSGYDLDVSSSTHEMDDAEHLILDVTTRFLDFEEAAHWLKRHIRPANAT